MSLRDEDEFPCKANFFLVGAPKAGTTSLDRMLRRHPDVFLSPIKEPCHFCPDVAAHVAPSLRDRKPLDLELYLASPRREVIHMSFVSSPSHYARLFEGSGACRVVGECSTFYLSSADAPGGIHAYNPEAKIVVLLRNPLDRIRSHYAMDRLLGRASKSLLDLVEEELKLGAAAHWGNCNYYVGASRYARQLQAYRDHFAPEQIFVSSFEELLANPRTEFERLFSFLCISVPAGQLALPLENKSRAARFPRLHASLRNSNLKATMVGLLGRGLSNPLGRLVRSLYYSEDVPLVPDEDLDRLAALLRDEGLEDEPLVARNSYDQDRRGGRIAMQMVAP